MRLAVSARTWREVHTHQADSLYANIINTGKYSTRRQDSSSQGFIGIYKIQNGLYLPLLETLYYFANCSFQVFNAIIKTQIGSSVQVSSSLRTEEAGTLHANFILENTQRGGLVQPGFLVARQGTCEGWQGVEPGCTSLSPRVFSDRPLTSTINCKTEIL